MHYYLLVMPFFVEKYYDCIKNIQMKQFYSLIASIILSSVMLHAQAIQSFAWKAGIGGAGTEKASDICIDNLGNVYAGGGFQQTVDFNNDPNQVSQLTTFGTFDGYVSKYNTQGQFQWVKRIGSAGSDNVVALNTDSQNNLYVAGMFYNTIVLDSSNANSTIISNGFDDVYLAKFDAAGNFLWVKSFGGTYSDNLKDMDIDSHGNVYLIGNYADQVDFDPSNLTLIDTAAGISDIYISKFDSQGNFKFVKTFGNANADEVGNSLAIDYAGNVFFAGEFNTSITIANNGLVAVGMSDSFVAKIDSAGNELWAKAFGGSDIEYARGITVDAQNFVIVTGHSRSASVQFATGNSTSIYNGHGLFDAYVVKFSNSGIYQWAQLFGGANSQGANMVSVDVHNDIYTGGYFYGTNENFFTDSISVGGSSADQDAFVIKFKSNGSFQWVRKFGSPSLDEMVTCKFDSNDNLYYFTKTFGNPFDVDFSDTVNAYATAGSGDAVLIKYEHLCNLQAYLSVNNYTITAMPSNASYQWFNCDSNSVIAGATNQQFTPTSNGNYAAIVTEGSCIDTSACTNINGLGLHQVNMNNQVIVSPNPSSNNCIIQSPQGIDEVYIYDLIGNVVMSEKTHSSKQLTLSVAALSQGNYVVKVKTIEGFFIVQKLVVKH